MIGSILIANRGEIAVRIIRACKDMGIRTVAIYSHADAGALHTQLADQAICIGPSSSKESYLNKNNIIAAACLTRCDAIHPGVGFLSENGDFAEATEQAGLIFIGPKPETIRLLGDKIASRNSALRAGVPVTPGSMEPIQDLSSACTLAQQIGYPVILKAASGGGGRGMRIVRKETELSHAITVASQEALAFFSDATLHMEKYLENPRHIEIQLLSDGKGSVIHLGERDCTVQKNHQKLIEESPSPVVDQYLRDRMCADSVKLFQDIGYRGVGTIEFLLHGDSYYFMEVNARIQVEHPVSELLCCIDLIQEQIRVAEGKRLSRKQQDIYMYGHALECRINAITCGVIEEVSLPLGPWIRIDSHMFPKATISPHYDPLIAKIIVHTPERQKSIETMIRALKEFRIRGINTNVEEQLTLLQSPLFRSGRFGTTMYNRVISTQMGGTTT